MTCISLKLSCVTNSRSRAQKMWTGTVWAYLGGCSIFPMLQRQRLCVWAAQALEGHPGAERPDVAHSDHGSPHTHQPSIHTGTQHPQGSQRLIVVQPVGDLSESRHPQTYRRQANRANITALCCPQYLALMWGMLIIGTATGSSSSPCNSAACFSKSIVSTWSTHKMCSLFTDFRIESFSYILELENWE